MHAILVEAAVKPDGYSSLHELGMPQVRMRLARWPACTATQALWSVTKSTERRVSAAPCLSHVASYNQADSW